jgi:hypothetical protein
MCFLRTIPKGFCGSLNSRDADEPEPKTRLSRKILNPEPVLEPESDVGNLDLRITE